MKPLVHPILPPPRRRVAPPIERRLLLLPACLAVLLAVGLFCIIVGLRNRQSPMPMVEMPPAIFKASRIGEQYSGRVTKSGEIYDSRAYVCAVKVGLGFKWGDIIVAQSIDDAGPRITVARVIDLLPANAPTDIDLSGPAFLALAPQSRGIVRVYIRKP